jgi:hypothetical protein
VHTEKHGKMYAWYYKRDRKRNTWVRSMTKGADIAERVKKLEWTHKKNGWQMLKMMIDFEHGRIFTRSVQRDVHMYVNANAKNLNKYGPVYYC